MSTNTDILNGLTASNAGYGAIASTTTTNHTAVDTDEMVGVMFVYSVLARTDGTYAVKLQDSPDNSTWTDLDSDQYVSGGGTFSTSAVGVSTIGCFGVDRYVRAVTTSTSVTTGATVSIIALGSDILAS